MCVSEYTKSSVTLKMRYVTYIVWITRPCLKNMRPKTKKIEVKNNSSINYNISQLIDKLLIYLIYLIILLTLNRFLVIIILKIFFWPFATVTCSIQ